MGICTGPCCNPNHPDNLAREAEAETRRLEFARMLAINRGQTADREVRVNLLPNEPEVVESDIPLATADTMYPTCLCRFCDCINRRTVQYPAVCKDCMSLAHVLPGS